MTGINIWVGGYPPTVEGIAEGISLLRWDADGTGFESLGTPPPPSLGSPVDVTSPTLLLPVL